MVEKGLQGRSAGTNQKVTSPSSHSMKEADQSDPLQIPPERPLQWGRRRGKKERFFQDHTVKERCKPSLRPNPEHGGYWRVEMEHHLSILG